MTQDQFEKLCQNQHIAFDFNNQLTEAITQNPPASKINFIWFEANACSGDSISMMNAVKPGLDQLLCSFLNVRYWNGLMPDQGEAAVESLFETVEAGDFLLAVEGAISLKSNGKYAIPFKYHNYRFNSEELLRWMAPRARYIVAVGTCAAFGGPSAARPNPSGSVGVWEIIQERPVVNVSGCPINPDWVTGTLYYLAQYGLPELDSYQRPTLFYGNTIHSACQRRSYFDTGSFARELGDKECMISKGCMGPVTGSDCPYRLWNDHLNWPV
jgi:hydrogenase small subunit